MKRLSANNTSKENKEKMEKASLSLHEMKKVLDKFKKESIAVQSSSSERWHILRENYSA